MTFLETIEIEPQSYSLRLFLAKPQEKIGLRALKKGNDAAYMGMYLYSPLDPCPPKRPQMQPCQECGESAVWLGE